MPWIGPNGMVTTRYLPAGIPRMAACVALLLSVAQPTPAAAQTAAATGTAATAQSATARTGASGSGRAGLSSAGASGSAAGTSGSAATARANSAPAWVLCPPPGASGAEPFVDGTNLSCAP
jgi:hypothetical protein